MLIFIDYAVARVQLWCTRFSITAVHVVFLWLLFTIPNSSLRTEDVGVQSDTAAGLLFAVILALVSLIVVQGSDPGYLTQGESLCTITRCTPPWRHGR
jgi:hypothetical protein